MTFVMSDVNPHSSIYILLEMSKELNNVKLTDVLVRSGSARHISPPSSPRNTMSHSPRDITRALLCRGD